MTTKKPKPPHVWVVEMSCKYVRAERWEPCRGAALDKAGAQNNARGWRMNNPGAQFRIAKYVRAEK